MKPANIEYLTAHRDCYMEILNAQTAKKAYAIKGELLRIMQEEFNPGYVFVDDCGDCIFNMTRSLYEQFDRWVKEKAANELEAETMEQAIAEPLQVTANFPINDKPINKPKHRRR